MLQEFYINDVVGILSGLKRLIKENCIKRFIKKNFIMCLNVEEYTIIYVQRYLLIQWFEYNPHK